MDNPTENAKGLIMVVDDEVDTREILGSMLGKLRYNCLLVESGKDAIDKYKSSKEKIDLVLLDIFIPQMSGKEIYEKLREIDPDISVLGISGYGEEMNEVKDFLSALNHTHADFIVKPFDMSVLDQKIDALLTKKTQ